MSHYDKKDGNKRYAARVQKQGVQYYLGTHGTAVEAAIEVAKFVSGDPTKQTPTKTRIGSEEACAT